MTNRIRMLRKEKKLTMKQLGEFLGVAESTISQYETEKRQPDNGTLIRLAEFFGVTVDYLLGRSDEPYMHPVPPELSLRGINNPADISRLLDALSKLHPEDSDPDLFLPPPHSGWLTNEKESAPVRDGLSDLDRELISMLCQLSPDDCRRVKDFVAGLKASREE